MSQTLPLSHLQTRLSEPMEYALKSLIKYGRFGPGVSVGVILALESRGLIVAAHEGMGLGTWEATEQGRSYYGEWLKGSTL
jgi:DNA-binding PadR family transcriptional regulator